MNPEFVTLLYVCACGTAVAALHWRVWRCSVAGFRARGFSRASCLARVAVWQFLGLLAPAALLLLLVGLEELVRTPLVPERIALLALGLTLLQLLAGLATFIAAIGLTRRTHP
jgi:hypothetical protein